MKLMSPWTAFLPAIVFAMPFAVTIAASQPETIEVRKVTVSIHGLDSSRPNDAAALYQRLRTAARNVCSEHGSKDMAARSDARRCDATALERAVKSVDRPLVTAAHRQWRQKRGTRSAELTPARGL